MTSVIDKITTALSNSRLLRIAYDLTCSRLKMVSRSNFRHAAVTPSARTQLLELVGRRIFTSGDTVVRRRPRIQPCPLTPEVLGDYTYQQVMSSVTLRNSEIYAGSWVIFVRLDQDIPTYHTVVGFFDPSKPADPENGVKHMNLCYIARNLGGKQWTFLASGTFVVGKTQLLVNARSGSWLMAKTLLRKATVLSSSEYDRIDNAVVRFAQRHVGPIMSRVFQVRSPS